MVRNSLSLFDNFNQLTPYAVGFDRVFDQLQNYVENNSSSTGHPPYNIRKDGEYNYDIEMALAGFSKKDIEVEVADGVLTIRSVKENEDDDNNLEDGESPYSLLYMESDHDRRRVIKVKNLKAQCVNADILVAAVGVPNLVKKDWVKKNSIIKLDH